MNRSSAASLFDVPDAKVDETEQDGKREENDNDAEQLIHGIVQPRHKTTSVVS